MRTSSRRPSRARAKDKENKANRLFSGGALHSACLPGQQKALSCDVALSPTVGGPTIEGLNLVEEPRTLGSPAVASPLLGSVFLVLLIVTALLITRLSLGQASANVDLLTCSDTCPR